MVRASKVQRGKRIAALPDCALILLLSSPRGLNALLQNIEETADPASLDGVPDVLAEEAARARKFLKDESHDDQLPLHADR